MKLIADDAYLENMSYESIAFTDMNHKSNHSSILGTRIGNNSALLRLYLTYADTIFIIYDKNTTDEKILKISHKLKQYLKWKGE